MEQVAEEGAARAGILRMLEYCLAIDCAACGCDDRAPKALSGDMELWHALCSKICERMAPGISRWAARAPARNARCRFNHRLREVLHSIRIRRIMMRLKEQEDGPRAKGG